MGNGNDIAAALWTATKANAEEAWHRDLSSSPVPFAYSLSVRGLPLVRNRRLDELRRQSK